MNVFVSECRYLQPGPRSAARLQELGTTLALPEDALTYILEITKFLATVGLILVSGLLLMLAG